MAQALHIPDRELQADWLTRLPTPKDERWKYTDLPGALRRVDVQATRAERMRWTGDDAVIRALTRSDDSAAKMLPAGYGPAGISGAAIEIAPGKRLNKPVEIFVDGVAGSIGAPALAVRIGAGAEATVIEYHNGESAFWHSAVAGIVVEEGARLRHYRLQAYGPEAIYTQATKVEIARDGFYEAFTLTLGSGLSRHEIELRLLGPGVHCEVNGVNLLRGRQHGDTTILVDHQAPHCTSHQFYRTVLDGRARGVFQGKIHVARAAQKTDGYQMSRALLLSDAAEMDTKPELEIYADDVKCSHGTTVGQLDEQALFYLRSRGVPLAEARGLLIGAFVDEAVQKITDEAVRNAFGERVQQWLAR